MSIPSAAKVVKLNVGGTLYHTSLTTLTTVEPESMLSRMVQQPFELEQIEQGVELFIDRNGPLFQYVLEYLRNPMGGLPALVPKDFSILKALKQEAEFYLLTGLIHKIDEQMSETRQPVFLAVGDRVRLRSSLTGAARDAGDLMLTRKMCVGWLRNLGVTSGVQVSEPHINPDAGILNEWQGFVLSLQDPDLCAVKFFFTDPYHLISEGDISGVPTGILEKF